MPESANNTSESTAATPLPADRRTSVRYRVERPATGHVFLANSFKTLKAHVVDLSAEGVGVVVDQPLEVGTRLHIDLPGLGDVPYKILADVLHVRPHGDGRWRCGCRLVWKLSEEELRLLAKASS